MTEDDILLADLRAAVRAEWGNITPYRMGLVAGSRGIQIACPYPNPAAAKLFREGVEAGTPINLQDAQP